MFSTELSITLCRKKFTDSQGCLDRLCGLVFRVLGYRSRGPGFCSQHYQIFWEVVGLERGPLSLVSITEELLEWKVAAPGLENREYGRGDPFRWPRDTLFPQKLALTSPTSGGSSVGIVRLRTKVTEFFIFTRLPQKRLLWAQKVDIRNQYQS
jgi:hypothetical protein